MLPHVKTKLKEVEDDFDQFHLILLLDAMQRAGFYNARGDSEVLSLVKQVVLRMDESSLKVEAEAMLAYLEEGETTD